MKVAELQINDWVMVNDVEHNHPLQVVEIFKKSGAYYATLYWDGMPEDISPDTLSADVDKILPIPLMPGTIEKNGFKKGGGLNLSADYVFEDGEFSIFITLRATPDKKPSIYVWNRKTGASEQLECERAGYGKEYKNFFFVHELQHALRLCGSKKEIII